MSDERLLELLAHDKAKTMWDNFTSNEKAGVRFGMFPAQKMTAATDEGHDSRAMAVAIMKVAEANGGMRA